VVSTLTLCGCVGGQGMSDEEVVGEFSGFPERERLCNDILNTGVMGALIGGFALGNLASGADTNSSLDIAIYLASFLGVHACTCSCVTSALLYRVANALQDEEAPRWAARNKTLLSMPMAKFGMGCISYLGSVVLISFRDLQAIPFWQYLALVIGLMSMSMTVVVAVILFRQQAKMSTRRGGEPGVGAGGGKVAPVE